jgi:hypothetical protein
VGDKRKQCKWDAAMNGAPVLEKHHHHHQGCAGVGREGAIAQQ